LKEQGATNRCNMGSSLAIAAVILPRVLRRNS